MKKKLFLAFVIIHLSVIVYNNIIIEEQSIRQYFFGSKEQGVAFSLLSKCPALSKSFDFYSRYTGAETGYGFYAPNVSSDIVIMLTSIDARGRIISIESPKLNSGEARVRCANALGIFMDKFNKNSDDHNKYMNAILKSIALWTFQHKANCKMVIADLLVYNLPSASALKNKKNPAYIKLGHYEYKIK